jgi:pimeloyl-ACP methyl ester carboxylesterase
VIICVHGLTRNAHDFDFVARALAQDYRIMSLDMPGRGQSEPLKDSTLYNTVTYMADCMAFMDNFHLRTVNWLGTSMGGIVGMMIAAMHQGRIKRLVLNDVGAFIPKKGLERIMAYVSKAPTHFASRAEAEETCRSMYAAFGIEREEEWQHLFRHSFWEQEDGSVSLAFDPRILDPIRADTKNFTEVQDVNLGELWKSIHIPCLILRGGDSDLLERETVSAMRSSNVRATSTEFAGVGHAPALLNDEQVGTISKWFKSQKYGGISLTALG